MSARYSNSRRGFSLLEAMILLTILSVVAVAAGVGLQCGVRGPGTMDDNLAIDHCIATQMDLLEQQANSSWTNLSSLAGTSTVTINNKTYTQTIAVTAQAPPDGSGGTATDFSKISVTIGSRSMVSYISQP